MNSTKSLLLVCALTLAAGPAVAWPDHQGARAQHDVDHDRTVAAKQDALSAADKAAEKLKGAERAAEAAAAAHADLAADLAGCPTCH